MNASSNKAKDIFLAAVDVKSLAERKSYLDSACADDATLRLEVEAMLEHHAKLGSFLQSPFGVATPTIGLDTAERPGTIIGPYKLLQQIGEGGMGVVFMAEQSQPVHRKVALKIIKPGMDSRQVIARFEAERQALAMMDHINIARVIDGGTTESGRPYFVMELINGVPITRYCDENHLTPRERLELFVPVCQAIQHAHQKGIIHRDIKPSNVLVTLYDGKPVPKVIDFGVAKATEQKLTERTLFTNFGTMVGTLEYMSPEQVEMSALGVDTRSDIYSLGVLLYELLTGSTPLSRKQLKEVAYLEILRLIKEEEPPRPSNRLSNSGDALASISAQRKTEPTKLSKLMRGELDWIVMKTLEKDRNRRYETANGLAVEVQRYLADEPVLACPPSAGYRVRKFVRRNKGPVLAASLILLLLVGGIVGTSWGFIEANGQRDAALGAAAAEKKAKEMALQREAETDAVLGFVENKIFGAARPKDVEGGLGYDVKLADAIKTALPFVEKEFADQPVVEGRLRMTLGTSYWCLGEHEKGREQCQAALALFTKHLGPDHKTTLAAMSNLATSYSLLGRHTDALKLRQNLLDFYKARLGGEEPRTLWAMNDVASSYTDLGRNEDAIKLYEAALSLMKKKLVPDDIQTLGCMVNLARTYGKVLRYNHALELLESAYEILSSKHPNHVFVLNCLEELSDDYDRLGRYEAALKLREKLVTLSKAKYGPDHSSTLNRSMYGLGGSYLDLNRWSEATKLFQEVLPRMKAKYGPDNSSTLECMDRLAMSYRGAGRINEAIKLHQETLLLMEKKYPPEHEDVLGCRVNLANDYEAAGRIEKAIELLESTLVIMRKHIPNHAYTLMCMYNLANNYSRVGKYPQARKLHEEAYESRKRTMGPDHVETLNSLKNLILLLTNCPDITIRNPQRALDLARESIWLAPTNSGFWNILGAAQFRMGNWNDAISSLHKSMQLSEGGDSSDWFFLAMAHWQLGQKLEARKWFDQAILWMEKNMPQDMELKRTRADAAELLIVKEGGSNLKQ